MKKVFIILFLFLFCFSISYASLIDVYKSGKITLVPDPNFGKGTEWDMYFPQSIKDIAFTEDGSFFATGWGDKACHCVYKFDKNGNFIKKFGQKGRGPGDFYHPGDLSILDNKYLLIGEYATSGRISVFDLNGNFVKIIKTKGFVFDVVALKNNKIAILSEKFKTETAQYTVYLKSIKTNNTKTIKEYKTKTKKIKGRGMVSVQMFNKQVFLSKIDGDKLLCGFSGVPKVDIFSFDGKISVSFKVNYKKAKVELKEKRAAYEFLKKSYAGKSSFLSILKRQYKNNTLLPDYKALYSSLAVDSEGNILVFKNNKYSYDEKKKDLFIRDKIGFKVFTKNGEFIKEILMNPEDKVAKILSNKRIWFYEDYIYYFDIDEEILKKSKIK